jgi:malonate-semialdehyde dehydrogenase (acetylating)/methylmalonate-semialdehyde dehydrogenase
VRAAKAAFRTWQDVPPVRRARPFFTLKHLMEQQFEALAQVLVQELGKTIADARAEMRRAIEEVECACGIPSLVKGDLHDTISPNIDLQVVYVPMGVFFMVPSFNFPALVPLEYYPYAVACGNTYVVKPSPLVPISQVRIFELIDQCGFPPGVLNLVHGDADVVSALMQHPHTQGFSFVGSTPVGKMLYAQAAANGKRPVRHRRQKPLRGHARRRSGPGRGGDPSSFFGAAVALPAGLDPGPGRPGLPAAVKNWSRRPRR